MSDKEIIAGKAKQIKGAIRDAAGDLTRDPSDDIKGKAEKAEGQIQEGVGRLNKAGKQLGRDLKKAAS
jgi:uncharacterized protein YjbJ (UPF0337 family)